MEEILIVIIFFVFIWIIIHLIDSLGKPTKKDNKRRSFKFDEIAQMFGGGCARCGSRNKLHKHHKKPLSKGGTNHPDNMIVLCDNCHKKAHRRR